MSAIWFWISKELVNVAFYIVGLAICGIILYFTEWRKKK